MSKYLPFWTHATSIPIWPAVAILGIIWLTYRYLKAVSGVPGLPVINRAERWDLFSIKMKRRFLDHANELMREGFEKVS